MNRSLGSASYWWMSARSRNASRRIAIMGVVGGVVFIAALMAFVLVPRRATKTAVRVTATLEERPDTTRAAATRDRAAATVSRADSILQVARQTIIPAAPPVVDTFPLEVRARRQILASEVSSLTALLNRAENAPLPSSYRALAAAPQMAGDPQVQTLLAQMLDIEREREAFGTVGGVDPVYVALTSRATAVGRSIQEIAEVKRAALRQELARLRPPPPPPPPRLSIDTMSQLKARAEAERAYVQMLDTLAQMRALNERIDRAAARARELENLGASPVAMLAAAIVLALTAGFAAALAVELRRPAVSGAREAEQVTGVRVLSVIEPTEISPERSRRQADEETPPLIDVVSEGYRHLYLHLAATEANVPVVTVSGDDAAIVATVAANIAAAAAYEARSTLLVDVDPTTAMVAALFGIPASPGLGEIVDGNSDWPEALVTTAIGRDRMLDILPSGAGRMRAPEHEAAERVRADFARMERRYDFMVIAAPASYLLRRAGSIIPAPDVVLCARITHTRLARLRHLVHSLRYFDLRIHGLVLWDDDMPVIEAHEESARLRAGPAIVKPLAGVR